MRIPERCLEGFASSEIAVYYSNTKAVDGFFVIARTSIFGKSFNSACVIEGNDSSSNSSSDMDEVAYS